MKYYVENEKYILKLKGYLIEGYINEHHSNYTGRNCIYISNYQDNERLETYLYELIKDFRIEDFPDNRIEFVIYYIFLDKKSRPIGDLPYPFTSCAVGIENSSFYVRFGAFVDTKELDEKWNKKWTSYFYFSRLSEIAFLSDEVKVYSEEDMGLSIDIEFSVTSKMVHNAVYEGISKFKAFLNNLEMSIQGMEGFFDVVELWSKKRYVNTEAFWKTTFKRFSWIISVAINEPSIVFEDEAFVGGKCISNKQGKVVDFLYKNKLTDNLAIIEIKTPLSKLIGAKYRNTYSMSSELSGAINQILGYKDSFSKNYYSLMATSDKEMKMLSPRCYLIIGSIDILNKDQRECFELFRKNLKSIEIITFDELFEKLFFVLSMVSNR